MSSAVITNYLYFIPVTMTMFDVSYKGNRFSKVTLITIKGSHVLIFLQQFLYAHIYIDIYWSLLLFLLSVLTRTKCPPHLGWSYYEASAVSHKVTVFLTKKFSVFVSPHSHVFSESFGIWIWILSSVQKYLDWRNFTKINMMLTVSKSSRLLPSDLPAHDSFITNVFLNLIWWSSINN